MPAELDSMFYTGRVPWHRQGTALDRPATAAEAIQAAGLDWEVQRQPLYTGPDRSIKIKDRYAICRTDRLDQPDGGALSVVGRDFTPLQNHEAFSFLDPIVDRSEAIYHTAGSLRGGRRVWLLAKLPGVIRVAGDDITEKYILLSNGHCGTQAVQIGLTAVRVVCMNTLSLALRGMSGIRIRHTRKVVDTVKQASEMLGLVNETYDKAGAVMQAMAKFDMNSERLQAYFERVMPEELVDNDKQRQAVRERRDRLTELFETGDGNQLPGVRGSQWCAYQAVTQYVDRESYTSRTREPLNHIWFGRGERLKRHAYEVAESLVTSSQN